MPAKNVTVSAIFEAGPAEFITADKEHPISDSSSFGYYVKDSTKWKNKYTFAGWFYNNNGIETEFTGSFEDTVRGYGGQAVFTDISNG